MEATVIGSTRVGDTLSRVAQRLYGTDLSSKQLEECIQHLASHNNHALNDLCRPSYGLNEPLPGHHFFTCSPTASPQHQDLSPSFLEIINRRSIHDRRKLSQYIDDDLSLPHLAAVSQMNESLYNTIQAHKGMAVGAAVGITTVEQSSEYLNKGAEDFLESFKKVNQHLNTLVKTPRGSRKGIRKELHLAYQEMSEKYSRQINRIVSKSNTRSSKAHFLSSEKRLVNLGLGRHHGFNMMDSSEARSVMRHMRYTHWLTRGCLAIDISLSTYNVVESYLHGGHWVKEAVEEVAELVGSYIFSEIAAGAVGSMAVALCLSSEGWVVILVGVAVGTTSAEGGGWFLKNKAEVIYDAIVEKWHRPEHRWDKVHSI